MIEIDTYLSLEESGRSAEPEEEKVRLDGSQRKLVDERHGCEDRLVHEALSGAV